MDRGVAGVILEAPFWSQGHVDVWREAGLSLMSGVCNSVDIARRVLAFGPDGFSSDRPHELRALLAADDAGRSPSVHLPARSGR